MEPTLITGAAALALWQLLRSGKGSEDNHAPQSGAQGDFRWATRKDLEMIGAFKNAGLPVGWFEGRPFFHAGETKPHGLIIGNTGSQKTTGILANIALSDSASKCSLVTISVSPDLSAICLPYRSRLGPCWRLDPADMLGGLKLGSTKPGHYNPLGEFLRVGDSLLFTPRAAKLSGMFVRTTDTRDRYFWQMAQRSAESAIRGLALHSPRHCNPSYLAKIFNRGFFEWARWLTEEKDIDEDTRDLLHPFLAPDGGELSKSIPECVNSVYAELRWIIGPLADSMKRSDFSFRDLSRQVCTVDICAPLSLLSEGWDRWVSLIAECALTDLQIEKSEVPVIFLFDEVAMYAGKD